MEGVMPREAIGSDTFRVKIGWAADQDVQIGLETDDESSLAHRFWGGGTYAHCEEWSALPGAEEPPDCAKLRLEHLANVGLAIRQGLGDLYDGKPDDDATLAMRTVAALGEFAPYEGVWATLTRPEINRVIRLLRRARDQAFGRDE